MQTFLIAGATKQERNEKIKSLIDPSTSKFDIALYEGTAIGIKDVRNIIRSLFLKPVSSPKKAVIILEAQVLSTEAQNALLKTLEEPPKDTIIILTAPNSEFLLPTIVSRCQVIELQTPTPDIRYIEPGPRPSLKLAEDLSKNKEEAVAWLENTIFQTREELIRVLSNNSNNNNNLPAGRQGLTIKQLVNSLKYFQKTHTILKTTNVNLRLTLENLFLNIS